ncbi:MAG: M20 family metallopeptidase [Gammaproteobacteria bacterium]|nr:M20 family metallopeptidase [Gammaproteobacteria bacterium]
MATNVESWVAWRRDIHKHPELGFREERTAAVIADLLGGMGIETHTGFGRTGVVGVLKKGSSDRSIGLRADIDALPIQEANDFEHRSVHKSQFHGCGHDGHTAMLLAAAETLSNGSAFDGTVHFIFQPNEENGRGALAMMQDGLFDRFPMDSIYGMHNMPGIPAGTFAVRKGPMMTFEDNFVISIQGLGGHASMPNRTRDPVVVAAEIISALQTVVARSLNPMESGVVSVTEILTDGARNVIPSNVTIKGDTRGLSAATQSLIETRMREIAVNIGKAHNVEVSLEYTHEFIVLNNTDRETDIAVQAAIDVVGEDNVEPDCEPAACSEDFAQMLNAKPGCYLLIGNGTDGHCGRPLHNPGYDFNDEVLEIGAAYWVKLTENVLGA